MATGFKVLFFLLWGNFLPPLASMVLDDRFTLPVDGNLRWFDGRPLFGPHKTWRGVLACLAGGPAISPLLHVPWRTAAIAAALLMIGDLVSSFIKRRLGYKSGSSVAGLDQIFEGLFPTLYLGFHLELATWKMLLVVILFIPIAHGGARFWKYILFKPPIENYPRIIRSSVRLREWRACHQPLVRWQSLLNLSDILYNRVVVTWLFKAIGLYRQGVANAGHLEVTTLDLYFKTLPRSFEGFRILLLTDLHLDGLPNLTDAVIARIEEMDYDLCLIGGDIRMGTYGAIAPCLRKLKRLLNHIKPRHGIYGVLGNHDCIEMVPDLEEAGILMLVNDAVEISRQGETIRLTGVDDPHYYKTADPEAALGKAPQALFTILLAHSPEVYREAARLSIDLYLCGHTHGGQIRLPSGTPIYTNSRAPRFTAQGRWQYRSMTGYTSRGVGASGAPLRFNCPGEITLLTLHRENQARPATAE